DTLTDQPERALAAEMLREKLLRCLDKEIPHGTAVVIEKMKTREQAPILDIDATIFCERTSHKGIIIGKGGQMLKKISTSARVDMERFFDCKVNLQVWVKVKEGWRNRDGMLKNFGFDEKLFEG
ncbi:MAG: KH domain-containing protein, partial [Oscillospiraceae bacterium]|nr:KH domain-containing protein [Oscillospiraceae bacterium]